MKHRSALPFSFVGGRRAVTTTGLTPVIDEIFEFADAKAAFERLRDGSHLGKLVIRVN